MFGRLIGVVGDSHIRDELRPEGSDQDNRNGRERPVEREDGKGACPKVF